VLPVVLPANQPAKFYRGGARIAEFRGSADGSPRGPEDWIASTVSSHGTNDGATRLPDGELLRDAVAAQPEEYLGSHHLATFGPNPALLVKLLDAGERLPVHCHPDRAFAKSHFDSLFGKTEAWLVLATAEPEGFVHLGFREQISDETVGRWFDEQPTGEILAAMNPIPVRAGDSVLVPAGMPHAIGAGIFLIELQEPTDFSVMLEWKPFGLDAARENQLGMPGRTALACMDTSAQPADELESSLVRRGVVGRGSTGELLPSAADPFFRASAIDSATTSRLEAGYSVLVVTQGSGAVESDGAAVPVASGSTVLIPYGAGEVALRGDFYGIRCLPPTLPLG
jgi:mannose-6-phosphate isomerase